MRALYGHPSYNRGTNITLLQRWPSPIGVPILPALFQIAQRVRPVPSCLRNRHGLPEGRMQHLPHLLHSISRASRRMASVITGSGIVVVSAIARVAGATVALRAYCLLASWTANHFRSPYNACKFHPTHPAIHAINGGSAISSQTAISSTPSNAP